MASGVTNRGCYTILGEDFRRTTLPTNLYVALCTDAVTPAVDTNTFSELTEIGAGNGYTAGGYSITPGDTDWDTQTEDDANDWAFVQLKDIVWTASGGPIPDSGDGARWAVLTDDNATPADRIIIAWWDLESARSVSDGQALTLQNLEVRLAHS